MNFYELDNITKLPYPEINITQKNLSDAKLLMNDYAGKASETTAIMQYMYQYYIVAELNIEFANALKRIANQEIHHHEMLGKTIVMLGGDPIISGLGPFWNSSYVSYSRQLKRIITRDIADEETTIRNYSKTLMCLTDKSVQDLINRIIVDEEAHIKTLKCILNHL